MGKKREAKNEKYGFGGRKRLQKQNDASSAADMDTFKQGRYNDGFGGRWGNILSNLCLQLRWWWPTCCNCLTA